MHQILFRLGSAPDPAGGAYSAPAGGAYSAPPDLLVGFKGPTSKGRGVEGREREQRGGEGRGLKGGE